MSFDNFLRPRINIRALYPTLVYYGLGNLCVHVESPWWSPSQSRWQANYFHSEILEAKMIFLLLILKNHQYTGAGEMAQQLKAFAAFPDDSDYILSKSIK